MTDLNGFSIELSTAPAPEEFLPLSPEIGKLPIPASAQLQIVEVLSVPQEHLQRLSAFLLPVAEELEVQLAPWVARAQPLADAWENFFRTVSIDTFTPVSYTHLDVYKRQAQIHAWARDAVAYMSSCGMLQGYQMCIRDSADTA